MNKPIQVIDTSKLISTDPPGMASKGHGEEGGDSFASIISRSTSDAGSTESGRKLQASGKQLPEQQSRANDQQYAGDDSSADLEPADATANPDVVEEPLPDISVNLPEHMTEQTPLQQALVPEMPAADKTGIANPAGAAEQPVNAAELVPARAAAPQLEQRMLAKTVPGNVAVTNSPGPQDSIGNVGAVSTEAALHLTAAKGDRNSSDVEPVANALREAVQQAVVNQVPGRDLKQFLQQNSNHQAAGKLLPVSDSAETQAVPFLQTLSDSALQMPSARIAVPVGQPGWGQAMGTQVAWFISQNINAASLRLNPQHLGPMEVEISLDGDKASVSFASQQGMVRDALESAIPRLREMLSENGLNLVNVNVSQQGMSRQNGQGASGSRHGASDAQADAGSHEEVSGVGARQSAILAQGLVDFYA